MRVGCIAYVRHAVATHMPASVHLQGCKSHTDIGCKDPGLAVSVCVDASTVCLSQLPCMGVVHGGGHVRSPGLCVCT